MGNAFRKHKFDLRIAIVIKLSLLLGFTLVRVGRTHFLKKKKNIISWYKLMLSVQGLRQHSFN